MLTVSNSQCTCGKCRSTKSIKWNIRNSNGIIDDETGIIEVPMSAVVTCECGNEIKAVTDIVENPAGELVGIAKVSVFDSLNTHCSVVNKPAVFEIIAGEIVKETEAAFA